MLLVRTQPNFEGLLIRSSVLVGNCLGDIQSGNICPGFSIRTSPLILIWFWPKTILDRKFIFDPNFFTLIFWTGAQNFGTQIFLTHNVLDPNCSWTQIFLAQFFKIKICGPNMFCSTSFLDPNFLGTIFFSSDKYKKNYIVFSGAWSKSLNQQNSHSSVNFCLRTLVAKHDFFSHKILP